MLNQPKQLLTHELPVSKLHSSRFKQLAVGHNQTVWAGVQGRFAIFMSGWSWSSCQNKRRLRSEGGRLSTLGTVWVR